MAEAILDLAVSYTAYTATIWTEEAPGGYWGLCLADPQSNGNVRANNSILLVHGLLAHAWDSGWLDESQREHLTQAGLDRPALTRRVAQGLAYICAHHVSAPEPLQPTWGNSWQSSLWIAPAVQAALLLWDELPPALQETVRRFPQPEADRIAATPPKTYRPGDSGAEENGWDTHALASAIALNPDHPRLPVWIDGLKRYAVNTYSREADRDSEARVGTDRVGDLVTTTNLFDDYTLDNHNFFHPDYVQVSGQHLGEVWLTLALGDRVFATNRAAEFLPYTLFNVEPVWEQVMKPLLLPDGSFLFPDGNDWTFHCSINLGYLAWIATTLGDPVALAAAKRFLRAAERRRDLSPPGRIFGEARMEWWWEPLLMKRNATALLLHGLRPVPDLAPEAFAHLDRGEWSAHFPDSKVWLHRNDQYAASVSWGRVGIGTFTPFGENHMDHPYTTIPTPGSLLPRGAKRLLDSGEAGPARFAVLELADGRRCALVCFPQSALWLSPVPLRSLGIQNDRLSGPARVLLSEAGERRVPALEPMDPFRIESRWLNLDGRMALVNEGGFEYRPVGRYDQRSVAVDRLQPLGAFGACQTLGPVSPEATSALACDFRVANDGITMRVVVRDGAGGPLYRVIAHLGEPTRRPLPFRAHLSRGKTQDGFPFVNSLDGKMDTFAVFERPDGGAPREGDAVVIELDAAFRAERETAMLLLVPRPSYGPRRIELLSDDEGEWKSIATAEMNNEPVRLPLDASGRWRLVLHTSRERLQRNVQLAEIQILAGEVEDEADDVSDASKPPPGFVRIERIDETTESILP